LIHPSYPAGHRRSWPIASRYRPDLFLIWSIWLLWFIWFVLFIELVLSNQTNETNQRNKITIFGCWRTFSASCKDSSGLLHPSHHIDERLVGKIELNETEPRVVEIENHVNGKRHDDRERNDVEPDIACFCVAQHIPGQQGTDQPENQEDGKY